MQMKKRIIIGLIFIMAMSIIGCGKADTEDQVSLQTEQVQMEATDIAASEDTEGAEITDDIEEAVTTANGENDILIVYFSAANLKDVDAVTSATPLIDGVSSVEWMAKIIQEKVGGEIVKLIPSEDYPLSYEDVADAAKKEVDNEARPAFEPLDVDPSSYKTLFLGYPMWWYQMPMVLETFFDTYDFSGVTIIPFNTHEGSRDGGTYDLIRGREPNATVLDGIAIRGGNAGEDSARDEIREWIYSLQQLYF